VPAVSLSPTEAEAHLGSFIAPLVATDNPVCHALARRWLDGTPAPPGLTRISLVRVRVLPDA
jgi:hypothetical protein